MLEAEPFLCVLCAFIMRAAPVPATSLAGSCVEAGFAECCDLGQGEPCVAPPTYCLCDPSCHEHDDCCDDIGEICSSGEHRS